MNNYPKLHNAMWPGLVGKGTPSEPFIDLDTMLELTASAESGGLRFEGLICSWQIRIPVSIRRMINWRRSLRKLLPRI